MKTFKEIANRLSSVATRYPSFAVDQEYSLTNITISIEPGFKITCAPTFEAINRIADKYHEARGHCNTDKYKEVVSYMKATPAAPTQTFHGFCRDDEIENAINFKEMLGEQIIFAQGKKAPLPICFSSPVCEGFVVGRIYDNPTHGLRTWNVFHVASGLGTLGTLGAQSNKNGAIKMFESIESDRLERAIKTVDNDYQTKAKEFYT